MLFPVVQIVYWISLAIWFGGVIFIALSAPVIFRAVRESNPILPNVLSVNLEGQHGAVLASTIVGNLITTLVRVELICAIGLAMGLIGQWFVVDVRGQAIFLPLLRTALYLAAVAVVIYDWRVIWPKIAAHRQQYIDHADEPDIANPAKDQFDYFQKESLNLLLIVSALLLAMILFSANIQSTGRTYIFSPANAEAPR